MHRTNLLIATAMASGTLLEVQYANGAEWDIRLGGYYDAMIVSASTETPVADITDVDVTKDAEIYVRPSITLDNGLTFAAEIQLEGETSASQIDESFAYIQGSFGRVLIGSTDGAAGQLHQGLYSAGAGLDDFYLDGSGFPEWVPDSNRDLLNTGNFSARANDAQWITYFTPRFAGFQLGVNYALVQRLAGPAAQ